MASRRVFLDVYDVCLTRSMMEEESSEIKML